MKILLTTLNAKYVHTSLALWYLYQFCRQDHPQLILREFNINQDLSWVCGEIYLEQAEVVAFSCNIWNIQQVLIICSRLKAVAPDTIIILGGPEAAAEPREMLSANPAVDFIICGEGELTFAEWLGELKRPVPRWKDIAGLAYRSTAGVPVLNEPRPVIADLAVVPFPYPREELARFRQKLVYYETTRGCPFHCSYCLSANERGVRYFPLERVQQELLLFIEAGIAQVKLVDRSFNSNPQWAKSIWRFLLDHPGHTNFHFEIVGDLLDEESLEILAAARPGQFQFEIGVQSTNPETLSLIDRKMDFARLGDRVVHLRRQGRIFVHLDLIAGLPGEGYDSFAKSFNDNMALTPNRLQLGFLKLLKGSGLRKQVAKFGYKYTAETPYEVMESRWISYGELLRLKVIEDLLERYYNSGRFELGFGYLISRYPSPFQLFEALGDWWKARGYDQISHREKDLYRYLIEFYHSDGAEELILRNLLKYDLLRQERVVELPDWAETINPSFRALGYAHFSFEFWQDPASRERFIPELAGLAIRDIQRRVLFAGFDLDPEDTWAAVKAGVPIPEPKPCILLFVYGGGVAGVHKVQA